MRQIHPHPRVVHRVKQVAAALNLDVHRLDQAHPARRRAAMAVAGVDLVLDVGANAGQYAQMLRAGGYAGWIVSFESIPAVFARLSQAMAGDPRWRGIPAAMGAEPARATLYVSADTLTSSLRPAEPALLERIPSAAVVEPVDVDVVTLAQVWPDLPAHRHAMLKVDVQGSEHEVLDGAEAVLAGVRLMEMEMGLTRLYRDGSTIYDLLPRAHGLGFDVVSIDSGFTDTRTGQVLDVDVLLRRHDDHR